MITQAPPTLQELAGQSLLRDEALAIRAVQDLPVWLFPPLFKEAFISQRTEVMRVMVQAWPFSHLTLGAVMKTPHLETLQAVLDGADMLLKQKAFPRRRKLQVLDLREGHPNFRNLCSGSSHGFCLPQAGSEKRAVEDHPAGEVEQPLKVVVNLSLHYMDQYHTLIFEWVRQRKRVLQACCRRMQIWDLPVCSITEVLKVFKPEHIHELQLTTFWDVSILAQFAPCLGQMRNLRRLFLKGIYGSFSEVLGIAQNKEEKSVNEFISHFSNLKSLEQLCFNTVCFLTGNLDRMLRSQTPLVSLWLTSVCLKDSDLRHLARCPSTQQLKHLTLKDFWMWPISPEALRDLLEKVAGTLETLVLENGMIKDAHFRAILPTLSRCSQLTFFSCCGNNISMAVLEDLLRHTARLSHLRQGLYPVPSEIYHPVDFNLAFDQQRLARVLPMIAQVLRDIRPSHQVDFCTFRYSLNVGDVYRLGPSGDWVVAGSRSTHDV